MYDPLLATKLRLPIRRKNAVQRKRLVERLNDGLWQEEGFVRKLTLVSAPAGFGKTTLVSEWLAAPGLKERFQAGWLSLEESDNDPARFLAYLIAALRQACPAFGDQTSAIVQLPQPPPMPAILTSLVNEISALPVLLIQTLDDYHMIHTPEIHQLLTFILDHQPSNLHLVILTREDPLLPAARLRAHGQLLEIRQDDLRFTAAETAEFLQHETGFLLKAEEIANLENHTEGWAAGLQLAALSLRSGRDVTTMVSNFAASDRFILDYLVEEVFERQPARVKDFLLRTSLLNRLNSALCDAVTGSSTSGEMLRALEQANLFIIPLDPAHNWYRYHHLFAELLHHRLRLSGIAENALHQRASAWYEVQGSLSDAVDHSLLAQDWGNAARLVGVAAENLFKRGEHVTLLNWCARLPQEVIFSSTNLCLVQGWAALMSGQFDLAAPILERAEQLAMPGSSMLGRAAAAQAFLWRSRHEAARAIEKSEQALALLPEDEIATRGNVAMNLGLFYWHEGRLSETEAVLRQACELCQRSGNQVALLTAQIFLARIPAVRGKLRQAALACEQLLLLGGQIPMLCLAHYDLATIHLEQNDLAGAMQHFEKGFALAQRGANDEFIQAGCLLKAVLLHALRDNTGAWEALAQAEERARGFPAAIRSRAAALGVQLALAGKDLERAAGWCAQVNAEVDYHSFYRFVGLSRACLWLAQGQKVLAGGELKKLFDAASRSGWGYGALVVRILQSLAAQNPADAQFFIADALRMGQEEGFKRSFLDAGDAVIPILQEAARRGVEPRYTSEILTALGAGDAPKSKGQQDVIAPSGMPVGGARQAGALSDREVEVLRLVAAGLSNREIARQLFISPGTAKTHIHNLCGKLGVRNRTEAAMKAKELNLA
jgi:LuxR family maltose regulon positive regulatory protein